MISGELKLIHSILETKFWQGPSKWINFFHFIMEMFSKETASGINTFDWIYPGMLSHVETCSKYI